jgi:hypothetical protein
MFICKNPQCSRSYLSNDGKIVTKLVRDLRTRHNANLPVHPPLALGQLAPRIYQNGELPCAGCGQVDLAHHTGPGEPDEVNTLLENIELLQNHGILPGAA